MNQRSVYLKNNEYVVEVQTNVFYVFDTNRNKRERKYDFIVNSSVKVLSYDEAFNNRNNTSKCYI